MPSIGKEDCYDSGSWLIDLLKLLSQPRLHESCKIQSLAPQGWVWFEVMFCRRPVAGLGERWEMNPAVGPSSSFRFKGVRKIVFVAMPQFPIWDGWQWWRAVSLHCRSDLGIPRRGPSEVGEPDLLVVWDWLWAHLSHSGSASFACLCRRTSCS